MTRASPRNNRNPAHDAQRRPGASLRLSDHYLVFLMAVLLGYAVLGKSFAYLGIPPVFIGEMSLVAGTIIFLRSGCLLASLATLTSVLLAITMTWATLRTLPFINVHGFDALRDSVIILYGSFALIVISLLLEDARRVATLVHFYSGFVGLFVPTIAVLFNFFRIFLDYLPSFPGQQMPILYLKPGDIGVHLGGAAVFALVGFRKVGWRWMICFGVAIAPVIASNRAAMMATVIPTIVAAVLLGKMRQVATLFVAAMMLLATVYALETAFTTYEESTNSQDRALSAHQIVQNLASVVGQSEQASEATKQWRLRWWEIIINDTAYGPNFWTGRGFGLNLADADNFTGWHKLSGAAPTRSPHSAHMTILARTGMPGLVLWIGLLLSWVTMLLNVIASARRLGQDDWAHLFIFVLSYAVGFLINSSFDVALEGPMQGIWFWCLFGFGIGSVMIFKVVGAPVVRREYSTA
jgi:hypothetical protein